MSEIKKVKFPNNPTIYDIDATTVNGHNIDIDVPQILKDLPTGSIATVNDAAPLPLNALTVSVEAWQEGSGDPSPSNVRPIHGWDSGEIGVVGKNWLPLTVDEITGATTGWVNNQKTISNIKFTIKTDADGNFAGIEADGTATATVTLRLCQNIKNQYNGMLFNGCNSNDSNIFISFAYAQSPWTENRCFTGGDVTVSLSNGANCYAFIYIGNGKTVDHMMFYPQIRLATVSDPTFEPYQSKSYQHAFTDSQGNPLTCYGAEWDVVDGGIKVTDGYIASYNGETLPSTWISDRDVYASGTTPTTGAEVVYKLATPTTIPQQPEVIRMLEGVNNLYADCGEVIEGEYFVDEGALDTRKVDYSIGSNTAVKVTDGRVLSGFASMSGYHSRPLDASGNWLDVDWSKDFEIGVAFKFTSLSANQAIFASADANRELVPTILWVASDATGQNQLRVLVSTDGSSWEVACITSFVPTINTFYFIKMKYESATKKCITQVTSDFIDWTVIENDTLATHPYYNGAGTAIGGRGGSSAWATNNLLIDTFNTYIKGDGVNWGAFTGAFPS